MSEIILGVHSMCETGEFREEHFPLLQKWYDWGARIVELVPFNWWDFPAKAVGKAARDIGVKLSLGFGLPAWADPTSADGGSRQMAYDLSRRLIDYGAECDAIGLYGAIHQAWGNPKPPSSEAWQRAVEGMRRVAEYSQRVNPAFWLGVENINRFEMGMLNTGTDLLRFVVEVDMSNVRGHWDLFHANIEEDDPVEALRRVGRIVIYIHGNDTHRGQPGKGHAPWARLFSTLQELNYNGPIVLESFNPDMPGVAGPTATWRRFAPTQDDLVRYGLQFLRTICEQAGLKVAA